LRLGYNRKQKGERQSGSKALECGSFRLWEIVTCIKSGCLYMFPKPEFKRLKVTTLNLFHPTASPPFEKVVFFHIVILSS